VDDIGRIHHHDVIVEARDEKHGRLALDQLSPRERQILDAALAGLSAAEIADRFSLSQATVRSHLSSIYGKLGVRGRVELLARINGAADQHTSPDPAPAEPSPPPRRRIPSRWRVVMLAGAGAIVVGCALIAFWRPDLPPRTDLGTVSRLLSQRQITQLDLSGTDLVVTRTDGQRFLVQGVTPAAWQSLGAIHLAAVDPSLSISVRSGGPTPLNTAAVAITALLPIALGVAAALLILRALRRRGPPAPFAG
jgi:DNA-binding CsgD family transcriptional regulator